MQKRVFKAVFKSTVLGTLNRPVYICYYFYHLLYPVFPHLKCKCYFSSCGTFQMPDISKRSTFNYFSLILEIFVQRVWLLMSTLL